MTLPSLTKTYQFNVNQKLVAAQGAASASKLIRTIKNSLTGFGLSPWTTQYSCNSVAAGTAGDGVDRWTTDANIVWAAAASPHSWYVLRQTGIATNFELCIDCLASQNMTTVISPSAAFSGGTTTARPTAADEIVVSSNTYWGFNSVAVIHFLHVMQSTDGAVTRLVINNNYNSSAGLPALKNMGFWSFEKPTLPSTGWTNPSASLVLGGNNAEVITSANLFQAANLKGKAASSMTMFYSCETRNNAALFNVFTNPNDFSGEFPMLTIGIYSDTASNIGRHARATDMYYGLANLPAGFTYPTDGSNQFAQFGVIILPWNGTNPIIY